jgi:hypothetical protein
MRAPLHLAFFKAVTLMLCGASLLAGCTVYEAPPPPPRYAYYHPPYYYAPAPAYGSVIVGARFR